MTIQFQSYSESCTGNDGGIIATVNGGEPPYTYDWSNGSTEPQQTGLAAGIYSLTVTDNLGAQATAQCEVIAWIGNGPVHPAYTGLAGLPPCTGECNGGFRLHLPRIIGMYTFNTTPTLTYTELPEDEGNPTMDIFVTYEFLGACANTTVQIDINYSCGTITDAIPIAAIEHPAVTFTEFTGSCNGADDGTVSGEVTIILPSDIWIAAADDGMGNGVQPDWNSFGGGTQAFNVNGLHPGDWDLIFTTAIAAGSAQGSCEVSVPFTIPDLGGACSTVSGTVHFETDVDCVQDGGEVGIPGRVLRITPGPLYTITAADGSYAVDVPYGTYDLEQLDPNAVQLCPPTGPVPFTVSSGVDATVEFADSLTTPFDMQTWVYAGICRVGFAFNYAIHLHNHNAHPGEDITVALDYDPLFTYIDASPAPTVNTPGHAEWTLATLLPFEHRIFSVQLQVPPDPGLMGTIHAASCTATSTTTDADPTNNAHAMTHAVVASYDPNDKQARTSSGQNDAVYLLDVDEWIDYTIRFQNTGTDTAFTITVRDTLSPLLDLASLQVLGASHAYTPAISDGNVLAFTFANILLPDSNVNEAASHGYVAFRLRPVADISIGATIDNAADIYFDFNLPVRTNTASVDVGITTGLRAAALPQLTLAPVPATDQLTLRNDGTPILASTVLAPDGRVVLRSGAERTLDVSALPPGAYLLQARFADGRVAVARFTK